MVELLLLDQIEMCSFLRYPLSWNNIFKMSFHPYKKPLYSSYINLFMD